VSWGIQSTCMCVNPRLYRSPKQPKLQCKKAKYAIRYLHGACRIMASFFFFGLGAKNPRRRNRVFLWYKISHCCKIPVDLLAHSQSEIFKVKSEYFSPETQALC
jgi:hypothetical protein